MNQCDGYRVRRCIGVINEIALSNMHEYFFFDPRTAQVQLLGNNSFTFMEETQLKVLVTAAVQQKPFQ
jgi:hypothetical protein